MTIKTMLGKGVGASEVARLLEVTEGAVRYHARRMQAGAIDGERTDLLALHMVLSHSRYEAVVWSRRKDLLAWLSCHTEAFRRLGGVSATVRVDNEKTAVVRGAGAWGTIHPAYRRYALMLRFHVDACAPREPQAKGKVERQVRTQRLAADPNGQCWRDLTELQAWTDERSERLARRRRCPATGASVWES